MKRLSPFLVFSVLFIAAGCGGSKNLNGRIDVKGTITLNGELLNVTGRVHFDSVSGITGDGGSIQTEKREILLTGPDAPKAGKYIVHITAVDFYDKKIKQPVNDETGMDSTYTVKVIPDDFNVNSKIEFEVVKDKKNVFNYDIATPNFKPVRIE